MANGSKSPVCKVIMALAVSSSPDVIYDVYAISLRESA